MTAIQRLCARLGVADGYHDIWGKQHEAPESTRLALLAALGHPVRDEASAAAELEAIESKAWRRGLPPVCVVHVDTDGDGAQARPGAGDATAPGEEPDGVTVRASLPAAAAGAALRWRVDAEDGAVHEGELPPGALAAEARRTLDGVEWVAGPLHVPVALAPGYHRLTVASPAHTVHTSLIVAPRRCYRPAALRDDGRVWGLSAQLYALRSARNWGIGDFTDLLRLVELAADAGAGVVGVSPLHALFPHEPAHASPYSPSSRLFLNTLHVDVEAVAEFAHCDAARARVADEDFQARLRALRGEELVRYEEVAAAKDEVMAILWRHFRDHHLAHGDARAQAFREFQRGEGEALRRHALYEVLQARLHADDPSVWSWSQWPEALRDPGAAAVADFARESSDAIEAREYAQWQAREQLDRAGRRAWELGLAVGLYQDLAVGVDAGGSETWSDPHAFALGARVGAPPDDFNLAGQDWGLPPWRPEALRESAYAPFVRTLRASMRAAGALRIDHVMGLARSFWIPPGGGAAAGTYVHYPLADLMGVLALESHRNQCLVVGEDLGTVPEAVRDALEAYDILSYRLLYFCKDHDGAFAAPQDFPARALVCAATHDLPTLAGFWAGGDLEVRRELGLFPDDAHYESQVVGRAEDRARLLLALSREGLLPEGHEADPQAHAEMTPELAAAIHRYLARSPSRLLTVQLEDLLGQREQVNLPGTTDAYPNWRRRLPLDLEAWADEPRIDAILGALRDERGRSVTPPPAPEPESGPPRRAEVPRATYRVQLDAAHGFDHAAARVPYLAALGISHVYCSPCLQARPGSGHGYDICDHGALNAELGGAEAFERFSDALSAHGMGLVMDVVPNHMGVMGADNAWWLDVLENGPASRFAEHFDIDWSPLKDELRGKVLVPVLGDHYGNVLDAGELRLDFDGEAGTLSVHYHEHRFPLDPRTYPLVIGRHADRLAARLGEDNPALLEFQSLIDAFASLPPRGDTSEDAVARRARDKTVQQGWLAELAAAHPDLRAWLEECLREHNGAPDYPPDRALLHELLDAQAWRLSWWRVAAHDINYRRFFDINDLAALRMEREEVFDATHALLLKLIAQRKVTGLRVDHPDGMFDPVQYFTRVQERVAAIAGAAASAHDARALWLVAEKILARDEPLPADWPVHGTTGYDFSAAAGGLFVDPAGEAALDAAWARFAGDEAVRLADIEYRARHRVMEDALAAELNVLARELSRIAESDPHTRDLTEPTLRRALAEVVACFPVYRTYITADGASERDVQAVEQAVAGARRRAPLVEAAVLDFVRDALLGRAAEGKSEQARDAAVRFAMRAQQFTAPVMAKGVEDTAFYRYHRLDALNEVGDDPGRFATPPQALHDSFARRVREWPHAMLGTSTHDSKRSEDVRMRLAVLSEWADEWSARAQRWSGMNRAQRVRIDDAEVPEPAVEYALYQSLLGIWPLTGETASAADSVRGRLAAHVVKAAREAKQRTAWSRPDEAYEAALVQFLHATLDPARSAGFLADFHDFQRGVARTGMLNSLALVLLKLTAPGVPDVYQGNEAWRFDLVDPDNRRAPDFDALAAMLAGLDDELRRDGPAALAARLLDAPEDGRLKLYVQWRALAARRELPALFADGGYAPLAAHGERAGHLFAFARRGAGRCCVIVVPRLTAGLPGAPSALPLGAAAWGDTRVTLPALPGGFRDAFTGQEHAAGAGGVAVASLLARFPVALLVGGGAGGPAT